MTSPNLSHFYISKKPLLVFQSSANLPNFRLPAPIGQNFKRLVMVFLKYNNDSNLKRSLLSIIQNFVANPSKMNIFFDQVTRYWIKVRNLFDLFLINNWNNHQISKGQIFNLILLKKMYLWSKYLVSSWWNKD